VYTGNVGTRFLIPVLPFVALAMAMTLDRVGIYLAPLLVLTHAIASWPPFLHRYSSAWSIEHVPHKAALGIQSEEQYLGWRQDYRIARMIEHSVPEGRRVLTVINVPDAYTTRDVLVSFQGAENEVLSDILTMGALADNQPRHAWVARFPPRQVRAIRVVQTGVIANPEEQWGVHEIRLYHRGKELQRAATWRLSSFPNPWDVGLAFDNSEATRWRTWETPRPGDFIKVNFGKDETVDEVRVETGSDNEDVRVSLEIEDTQGRWTSLGEGALMQKFHMTYEGDLQRAAAIELHARGIDYILMRDMDWCCSSFAKDPASFHLTVLGRVGLHGSGATLYRIDSQEKP
jgi:hypothetical protein